MDRNPSSFNHHCIASLRTLTPHITCLAVNNNLLYAASVNLINVYDLSHYTHVDVFNDNNPSSGFVKSITFSSDGSRIFTAHQDCKIRIWLITSSKRHRVLSSLPTVKDKFRRCMVPRNYVSVRRHRKRLWIQHCDTVSGLVVNEGVMYSVSWDKSFKIWDLESFRCLESVKAHEDAINAVVVSNNGTVYTASADGYIKVWEKDNKLKKHMLVRTIGKMKSTVNTLSLNKDETDLFSGGCDGAICCWKRKKNDVVKMEILRGHGGAILCLINVEGLLVSGSTDRTVRIWKREKGNSGMYCCKGVLEGHEKPVKSLVAFTGGEGGDSNGVVRVFSGSLDGDVRVWELFPLD
ncbi:hypothetical protein TanjilG_31451 [Lupinus angustifolius]|uniref:Anaphase-promoting complex subunit 4 WD40 domain-containing protein n=1 Tax=Lupinus angustifolius TaxID=3871 RepID=A0A4P1RU81_LUPAN|nr:PREDICTED: vegetative incompatibility protein HET-E-1-like [Lupinus angustifolius]OIW18311.1 hypothetical protein TanjilG_31451 [Lupinus angustifolius]